MIPAIETQVLRGKDCQQPEDGRKPPSDRDASSRKSHSTALSDGFKETSASDHLNMIRGVAALVVLVFHVRYRFFYDYADLTSPGKLAKAFYAVTSFGHDAVMVFFVLSGFLISASIKRDCALTRWSWKKYLTNRAVRLYVVLIPGLALTLFWDRLGLSLFPDAPIYTGARQAWHHDFFPVRDQLAWPVLLGNLAFLQTIVVQPFGSNAPLWSLANEFWYYLLFPCLFVGVLARGSGWRRACFLAAAVGMACLVGKSILIYFPIWLAGTALCFLPRSGWLAVGKRATWCTWATLAVFLAIMAAGHVGSIKQLAGNSVIPMDYLTALSFASFLYCLLHRSHPAGAGAYASTARIVADFSYTLYVAHMPLLVFLRACLNPRDPWPPDLVHMGLAVGITLAVAIYALLISRVTEAKTDVVRQIIVSRMARPTI